MLNSFEMDRVGKTFHRIHGGDVVNFNFGYVNHRRVLQKEFLHVYDLPDFLRRIDEQLVIFWINHADIVEFVGNGEFRQKW